MRSYVCFLLLTLLFSLAGCNKHEGYVTITKGYSQTKETKLSNAVVVLMVDNRPLVNPTERGSIDFQHYTAAMNSNYAKTNGYDFRWYRSPCPYTDDCVLDDSKRRRSAPWAKIVAINETLHDYSRHGKSVLVFYIDSDAFIANHESHLHDVTTSIALWENERNNELCTGAMLFRNTKRSYEVLDYWWKSEALPAFDKVREWEQAVLNQVVLSKYHSDFVKLPSVGWMTGLLNEKRRYWDSGFFDGTQMKHGVKTVYSEEALRSKNYTTFIKHMWCGQAARNVDFLEKEMTRTKSSFLRMNDLDRCSDRHEMYCLRHSV